MQYLLVSAYGTSVEYACFPIDSSNKNSLLIGFGGENVFPGNLSFTISDQMV